ncbi:MAG: heme-copper oxidase subunit III [Candidatus Omnitrophica bacterium]|nr:heme-copper oxidase subunit III [Candidatus Omnitrophota bacterium]
MNGRVKQGMILFVLSEANFFLLLVCAYIFYHQSGGQGPTAASALDVFKTSLFSVALFSSSFTVWRAGACSRESKRGPMRFWLLATILLGALFLIGQGTEYAHLIEENVTISRNLFGTTFFTLTGFHGLHVFIGLVLLTILLGLAVAGNEHEPRPTAMEGVSIYWHFVDAVWVVIFLVVYLWKYV